MNQELSSPRTSATVTHEPTAVYEALAHSILAHEYEKAFLEATGLRVQLVLSHEPTQRFRLQGRKNAFCRLMAQSASSCAACQRMHEELRRRIADSLTPQTIYCFAGLAEFAVPVVVDGQHVATLLGGQVFRNKPTQTQFEQLARRLHVWEWQGELGRVETAFFQTQVISRKKLQATVRLLMFFTKLLAEDVNRNLLTAQVHDRPCITIAKNFILARAGEPLHLRDVAEHVHVSPNYFCKFFKKATGMRFSEFLARARVETAKNSLADPVLSITEVANQAGFGSLSQFNRTFHRYVGCSPTAYRASLRETSSF